METENEEVNDESINKQKPPSCHFTPMNFEWADDGCQQVEYWICQHCGHTKEIERYLAG